MAEGNGLLNRHTGLNLYRGFESLPLRQISLIVFPVPVRAGTHLPAAFAWTGVPSLFTEAGFNRVSPRTASRPIFRLDLSSD